MLNSALGGGIISSKGRFVAVHPFQCPISVTRSYLYLKKSRDLRRPYPHSPLALIDPVYILVFLSLCTFSGGSETGNVQASSSSYRVTG
jgi:hypothetical protein